MTTTLEQPASLATSASAPMAGMRAVRSTPISVTASESSPLSSALDVAFAATQVASSLSAPPEEQAARKLPSGKQALRKSLEYFPLMRMVSYLWEATYQWVYERMAEQQVIVKAASRFTTYCQNLVGIDGTKNKALQEQANAIIEAAKTNPGEYLTGKNWQYLQRAAEQEHKGPYLQKGGWLRSVMGVLPFTRDVEHMRRGQDIKQFDNDGNIQKDAAGNEIIARRTRHYMGQKIKDIHKPEVRAQIFARNLLNVIEAVVFIGVTSLARHFEHKDMLNDFAGVVALEKGKKREDIHYKDIKHSSNPFVKAEIEKTGRKYLMRYFTDAAFAWGLKTGIVLKMSTYPIEYGSFKDDSPLTRLRKTLNDIDEHHMNRSGVGKERLVYDMTRLLQQTLSHHKHAKLDESEVERVTQRVLDPLADAILKGKAGISDFCWVFGELSSNGTQVVAKAEAKYQQRYASLHPSTSAETISTADLAQIREKTQEKSATSFIERLPLSTPQPALAAR